MPKAAILILADNQSHGDTGYLVNALETARQFQEAGDEVKILFDGAGTQWVPYLENTGSDLHPLYAEVQENVEGVCKFCAGAYDVEERVEQTGVRLLDDARGHPDIRSLMVDGYTVLTF